TLRNTSSHTCRTQGWVGMQLIHHHGRNVPTDVIRSGGPSHRVTLAPGERAVTTLHWAAIPADDEPGTHCEPTAQHVRIAPPDETHTTRIKWKGGAVCQHGRIDVNPLRHR